jgi:hypothetical protein
MLRRHPGSCMLLFFTSSSRGQAAQASKKHVSARCTYPGSRMPQKQARCLYLGSCVPRKQLRCTVPGQPHATKTSALHVPGQPRATTTSVLHVPGQPHAGLLDQPQPRLAQVLVQPPQHLARLHHLLVLLHLPQLLSNAVGQEAALHRAKRVGAADTAF